MVITLRDLIQCVNAHRGARDHAARCCSALGTNVSRLCLPGLSRLLRAEVADDLVRPVGEAPARQRGKRMDSRGERETPAPRAGNGFSRSAAQGPRSPARPPPKTLCVIRDVHMAGSRGMCSIFWPQWGLLFTHPSFSPAPRVIPSAIPPV